MDRELLIEIGVEELPASWLPDLTRQMAERTEARLRDLRIAPGAPVESFSTPRRLTVRIAKIAERQEDLEETITGPPVSAALKDGQPTPAGLGFARKQGVEFDQITRAADAERGIPGVPETPAGKKCGRRAARADDGAPA